MKVSFFFSAVKFFEFQGHFFIEVSLDLTNNLSCSHTSASKDLTLCTELKKKAVVGKNTPQVLSLTPEGSRLHLFQIPVGFQCLRAQKHQAQWVNSSLNLKRKKIKVWEIEDRFSQASGRHLCRNTVRRHKANETF